MPGIKRYKILRHYTTQGTYGEMLREDGSNVCYTCERPQTGEYPCIREGAYAASRYNSPKHGPNTWQLEHVPGRTHIQFHVANWPSELLGCIAPGTKFGASANGEWGVLESRKAYAAFMDETKDVNTIVFTLVNKDKAS